MLPGKAEKRIASSIFITLVPPQRDRVIQNETQPPKAPLFLRSSFSEETLRVPDGSSPQSCRGAVKGGRPGATGGPGGSSCALPPPPELPAKTVESDRDGLSLPRLLPPPPPSSSPCCVETLGPDLQSQAAASSTPVQVSSAFPADAKQNEFFPSTLGWTEQGPVEAVTSTDVCAFCHKSILPRTPALEAMNKQYHADCFLCRLCQCALVGHRYYHKDGRPLCVACYQKSLEKCATCQGLILEHIVRALGRAYHPECFTCVVCNRALGDETFAVDDESRAHCLDDFYRKFASVCSACARPIIPSEGRNSYKIECLGRSFHEDCYRCERCWVLLSPEPMENGCFPLGSSLLCRSCHTQQRKGSSR